MGLFRGLLRRGPRIPADTLGIHDLSGGAADTLTAADRAALAALFRRVSESSDAPPRSALLLVYCTIGADGAIAWAKLVRPKGEAVERPHTLLACELGKLAFR